MCEGISDPAGWGKCPHRGGVLVWGDRVRAGEKSTQRGDAPVWAAPVQWGCPHKGWSSLGCPSQSRVRRAPVLEVGCVLVWHITAWAGWGHLHVRVTRRGVSAQAGRWGHPHGVQGQVTREWVPEKRPPGLQSQSPGRVARAPWQRPAPCGAAEPRWAEENCVGEAVAVEMGD